MTLEVYNPPRISGVGDPSGGATQDAEARRAHIELAGYLRSAGILTINALSTGATGYTNGVDHADYDITADVELGGAAMLTDYTPAANSVLVGKYVGAANQRSYRLSVRTDGTLRLEWSVTGNTVLNATSTVAITTVVAGGAYILFKTTMDVDDGSSNRVIKFWWRTFYPLTYLVDLIATTGWTQLGATVTTAGTTSIFASTALLRAGASFSGAGVAEDFWLNGKIAAVMVKNGLDGTVVASPDFNRTTGETVFTDSFNRTWTPQSTAVYAEA